MSTIQETETQWVADGYIMPPGDRLMYRIGAAGTAALALSCCIAVMRGADRLWYKVALALMVFCLGCTSGVIKDLVERFRMTRKELSTVLEHDRSSVGHSTSGSN